MEADIVCEGYLTKAPPLNQPRSKWCYRYFTLDKTELVLKYYKDKEARSKSSSKKNDNAKGVIHLSTVHHINDSSDHALANNYRHGFELDTEKRLWILIADTEKDMVNWLSCLTNIFGQSKRATMIGSPNPGGSPGRRKTMFKKVKSNLGKIPTSGPGSNVTLPGQFNSLKEDSSSSSVGDDVSQFDEDDDETLPHSKSVSSHMSSADSAIGSEKSSKVRLTDGLLVSEPLYDEISQKEWIIKANKRNTGEIVQVHISTATDNIMPSEAFIMRSQIGSPTLSRTIVDGVSMYEQESEVKTPGGGEQSEGFYDFPANVNKRTDDVEPLYDTPSPLALSSVRKVETVTKKISTESEDLYDIPSNVIKSLQSDKPTNNLYDSLAPAEPHKQTNTNAEIYDVPVTRKHKQSVSRTSEAANEIDGQQGGASESPTPEIIYDTPPSKRGSVSSSHAEFNSSSSRRATGASNTNFSSTSSRTTSISSINQTTAMLCRADSIDSAYQLLVIADKEGNDVGPIHEEEPVYNIPPSRPVPQPVSPARPVPQPARPVPQPVSQPVATQQVLIPPPRTEPKPVSPSSDYRDIVIPVDPTPPPSRSPPKPILPPRTDRPPVPDRGQTLGRPSRPPPEDVKSTRPQSDIICRPNRPVPLPPSVEREPSHFELTRNEEVSDVGSNTLTRAKLNERDHQSALERRPAPLDMNEYTDVRQTPMSPSTLPERATPPPLTPRSSLPPRAALSGPTQSSSPASPRTISAGIGLSTMSAAFGAPFTPPRIPQRAGTLAASTTGSGMPQVQRAGTIAGSTTTNPFLDGFVPPRESATMSRMPTQPRQFGYGLNKSATFSSTNKAPSILNLSMSKHAQDEFDSIPDTPSPETEKEVTRTAPPLPPAISVSTSGNSKYPTIKNNNIGMVKVKQGYQNVTEVKGALGSRGPSQKGESHNKLTRRDVPARQVPAGYTPMDSMKDRMKKAAAAEKQGYEPMISQQQRMANYNAQQQQEQQNSRPLPPRSLTVAGDMHSTTSQQVQSPIYVDATGVAPIPDEVGDDITQLPEYIRMGEIDMTLHQEDYLPMSSADQDQYLSMANWQDEYQSMDNLANPQDDYLAMGRSPHDDYLTMGKDPQEDYLAMGKNPQEDYLAMGKNPQEDYLAMGSAVGVEYHNTGSGDTFSNLTFSNS